MKALVCIALLFCATAHSATNNVRSTSYQEALRAYGATPAYKQAVADLLTREARWIAERVGIQEAIFPNPDDVHSPSYGITGTAVGTNYTFTFLEGSFRLVRWNEWFAKINPPAFDMLEFARRPCLLDNNSALQLARTWLTNVGVNLPALEAKSTPSVFHVPASSVRDTPPGRPRPMRPQFIVTWPGPPRTVAGRTLPPRPGQGLVVVEILGTTKQLIELRVEDATLWTRPKLELKNAAAVIGPDPTPAELMARIITPVVHKTITEPDSIQAWLLTSSPYPSRKKDRLGPANLAAALAKKLTNALLDLDSYDGFDILKGCIPDDGARLLIKRGDHEVHIAFCFECNILTLRTGTFRKVLNFGRGHNRFADLLQEIFPNDAALRSIPRRSL